MGIPNATHQIASDAIAAVATWVSIHTGVGAGTTGANEATGGGYARKQTTYTPNSSGSNVGTEVNVPVAAGTYTEGGLWSAVTSGTFRASAAFAGGSVVVSGSGASIDITPTITA